MLLLEIHKPSWHSNAYDKRFQTWMKTAWHSLKALSITFGHVQRAETLSNALYGLKDDCKDFEHLHSDWRDTQDKHHDDDLTNTIRTFVEARS